MKISVIIPTRNAEPWLERQLACLKSQTVKAEILVVDSGSTDATLRIVGCGGDGVRLIQIPSGQFDHGGTRDFALQQCEGDIILFLSQDAVPTDGQYIEKLLLPFGDDGIAGVYCRQVAWPDAPEYEKLTRAFNYPEEGRVWSVEDIPKFGVKAYFFSDTCSAIRRSAYEAVGGFDRPIITNEDMMIAAKFLHAGWRLAYQPEATVWHSHHATLADDYRRNCRIGTVMERYRDRLVGADSAGEGTRMVRAVCGELIKERKPVELLAFLTHAAVRLTGYHTGRRKEIRRREQDEAAGAVVML